MIMKVAYSKAAPIEELPLLPGPPNTHYLWAFLKLRLRGSQDGRF